MIFSFVLGAAKKPWWGVLIVVALVMAFRLMIEFNGAAWKAQVGVSQYNSAAFVIDVLITIIMNYLAFGLGLLARAGWLRFVAKPKLEGES